MSTLKCDRCSAFGLKFRAAHISPSDYLEGKQSADIWIIGLNPKGKIGYIDSRTKEQLENFDRECHSYFDDFRKVSQILYNNWKSSTSRIAHTDLVKCFSPTFPPNLNNKSRDKETIINNCKSYLLDQIKRSKPKIIICNGSDVCKEMINFFPPNTTDYPDTKNLTSYKTTYEGHSFWIIMSGFIGRIDDRNKRRLGKEIEHILELEKIEI